MKRLFRPGNSRVSERLSAISEPKTKEVDPRPAEEAARIAILDEDRVQQVTSLSRTTRWRLERRGQFPKRVRLSPGRVGWRQADIEAWISSRAA